MPVKVSPGSGGVEVPTMDEFIALRRRVEEIEAKVLINGDNVALVSKSRGETITWMTGGGEIKSRADVPGLPDDQVWTVRRR